MQISPGNKKGQQLIMPIARSEETPDILEGYILKSIDLRSDWQKILQTIYDNKTIQQAMEKSYQNFQEGFRLKDFKHRNGVKGAWSFKDINEGIYPYTLTTTDWILEYEKKEWEEQATDGDRSLKDTIENAIDICNNIDNNSQIMNGLEQSLNKLLTKYPPRTSQPEIWRPQNASHWSSQWIKVLAEIHYNTLSNDWRLVASNTYSIVAGFSDDNTAYLIDIILLTTNPEEIVNKLYQV